MHGLFCYKQLCLEYMYVYTYNRVYCHLFVPKFQSVVYVVTNLYVRNFASNAVEYVYGVK